MNVKEKEINIAELFAAETIDCDNCTETIIFDFSNAKNENFQIGLTSILECLAFAVERGAIPKLPTIWWEHIKSRYANNSNNDFAFSGDIWVNEDNYEQYMTQQSEKQQINKKV